VPALVDVALDKALGDADLALLRQQRVTQVTYCDAFAG